MGSGGFTGLWNGQSWVLIGRRAGNLGMCIRISGPWFYVFFFSTNFLNAKKKKIMTSAIHILHKFCILQINN